MDILLYGAQTSDSCKYRSSTCSLPPQKAKYALRALLHLAEAPQGEAVLISEIATRHDIPKKFLEQILLDLKNHGVVQSWRGRSGGYALLKPASEISFGQVLRIIDGPLAPLPCLSRVAYRKCSDCHDESACALRAGVRDQPPGNGDGARQDLARGRAEGCQRHRAAGRCRGSPDPPASLAAAFRRVASRRIALAQPSHRFPDRGALPILRLLISIKSIDKDSTRNCAGRQPCGSRSSGRLQRLPVGDRAAAERPVADRDPAVRPIGNLRARGGFRRPARAAAAQHAGRQHERVRGPIRLHFLRWLWANDLPEHPAGVDSAIRPRLRRARRLRPLLRRSPRPGRGGGSRATSR